MHITIPLSFLHPTLLILLLHRALNLNCVFFTAKISEETFQTVLDRVATTKDFSGVRDNILFFLQVLH